MVMDPLWQNFSTVQSNLQQGPTTIAASTTIAPISFLTKVTGTTAVNNVTVPPSITGLHVLALQFTATNPSAFGTTGNINVTGVTTPGTNSRVTLMVFDPTTNKYQPILSA